jgi:hypothetical protein
MPLVKYDEVRPWAKAIQEKVVERTMPPFHADGPIGRYVDDHRLTDEQIALISKWVESGSPEGRRADMPKQPIWKEDWQAGHPDVVLWMPKAFKIQPNNKDDYAFFILDYKFQNDTWIRGVEVRPGARRAVHHVNVYLVPPSLRTSSIGRVTDVFDPVRLGAEFFTAWEPGSSPFIRPANTGFLILKGTRIGIQMHYSPSEQTMTDRTSVGVHFSDGRIQKRARVLYGGTKQIDIQPGEDDHLIIDRRKFDEDSVIKAFTCHMHLRGKSFAVRFRYPDGRHEIAFNVPRYDANWQEVYVLAKSIVVPKGTIVEYIATFDNSAKNRLNPDPTQRVQWGDRVVDEMMDGYLYYVLANENLNVVVKKGQVVSQGSERSAN